MIISARRQLRERLFPWTLAAILLSPSIYWVTRDRSVWSWDPSDYGAAAVDLWFDLLHGPAKWFETMRSVLYAKAPGISWLGQLFVPVGRWVGSVEHGLLASVLLVQAGTLVLLFGIGRRIAPASVFPAAVGTLLLGASPLFVSMSHHFMTEALQAFAVTYVYWVAVHAPVWPAARTLPHLVLAMAVAMLAKFNTPAFVVFAAAFAAYHGFRAVRRERGNIRAAARRRDAAWAVAAVVLVALGTFWYARNGKDTYRFAKLAASSDVALHYGRRGLLTEKLVFWLDSLRDAFLSREMRWAALTFALLAVWAIVHRLRNRDASAVREGAPLLVGAATLQLLVVLAIFAVTINEEARFLLALGPTVAILVVWGVSALRSRWAYAALALALMAQWGIVHGRHLGLLPSPNRGYWSAPPVAAESRMSELTRVVDTSCDPSNADRWVMTGVDLDWLNLHTLAFYAAKARLDRGYRCRYEYLGHAQKSVDAGLALLAARDVTYFVSLDARVMPAADFLNEVALPVLRRIEGDPGFARVPFESESGIVIFRRLVPWPR